MRTLLLGLILAACGPPDTVSPEATPLEAPEAPAYESHAPEASGATAAETEASWEGRYSFSESVERPDAPPMLWEYVLTLQREGDHWRGTLHIDGFQTLKRFEVRGDERDGTLLDVTLTGYGEENVFESPALGDTLFTLEAHTIASPTLTTWGALTPNATTEAQEEPALAFSR